uniref:C-type cytochrome n=1 Tax=Desulfobacca acetoxidans TaxID=60893 RepID=A0A7V4GA39_9BACT
MKLFILMLCLAGLTGAPPALGQPQDLLKLGQEVYENNCADCHRRNGEGLPVKFPALKGNSLVLGDAGPLLHTILQGRKGKWGLMPAWAEHLNDQEIAGVAAYIRSAWGNQAPPVTPAEAAAARIK